MSTGRIKRNRLFWFLASFFGICLLSGALGMRVRAEDETGGLEAGAIGEKIMEQADIQDIDAVLKELFPSENIRFRDILDSLVKGETDEAGSKAASFIKAALTGQLSAAKQVLAGLLMISVAAALFSRTAKVFHSTQAAEMGFYMMYLLLMTTSLRHFRMSAESIEVTMEHLLTFMKVLSPAYFVCMAVSTGSVTSVAFYQIVFVLIYMVEKLILHVVMPVIDLYLVMKVLNELSEEPYLTKAAELMETIVNWILKAMLACVTGVSIVQGLLNPAVDAVRRSTVARGIEMIPGIGNAAGGTLEIVLAASVLIKNGIGMAGVAVCAMICLVPFLNVAVPALMYQGLAAVIQPVAGKQAAEALGGVANAYKMLMKAVGETAVLFFLTIAVAAVFTS